MTLQSSGAISFANINTELGRSSTAAIGIQQAETGVYAAINTASTSRPDGSSPYSINEWYGYNHTASSVPTPEYWWRADSGLSTTSWTAYNGGVNFTLTNVSSANSTTGLYLNGTNSYGTSSSVSSLQARHIFIRGNNLNFTGAGAFFGGSIYNIHEFYYYVSANASKYIVESDLNGTGFTYAAQGGQSGTTATWIDMVNYSAPAYHLNSSATPSGNMTVYAGTYTNRFWWPSGNIYLGIRKGSLTGDGGYLQGYIKEIAIFTTSLTEAQGATFLAAMNARWP